MVFKIDRDVTDDEVELRKRIYQLAGSQARIALLVVLKGKDLKSALDIAESYPPVE